VTLRVFNPDDDEASIGIGTRTTIRAAERVNFLEEPQSLLAVDGTVQVVVGPQRIETVRLSLDRRDVRNE
jgi:alpha-mannosidase